VTIQTEKRSICYDAKYYLPIVERYKNGDRFTCYRLKNVFEIYYPQKGEKILDLGCGMGTFSLELAKRGHSVTGLDQSKTAIEICRKLASDLRSKPQFILGDAMDTKLPDAQFDIVLCADLVEHIESEKLGRLFYEIRRILKPNGKFVIWTPNPAHIFEWLKKRDLILKKDRTHIGLISMNRLKRELVDSGFRIKRAYYVESHWPIFNLIERFVQSFVPFLRRRSAVLAMRENL